MARQAGKVVGAVLQSAMSQFAPVPTVFVDSDEDNAPAVNTSRSSDVDAPRLTSQQSHTDLNTSRVSDVDDLSLLNRSLSRPVLNSDTDAAANFEQRRKMSQDKQLEFQSVELGFSQDSIDAVNISIDIAQSADVCAEYSQPVDMRTHGVTPSQASFGILNDHVAFSQDDIGLSNVSVVGDMSQDSMMEGAMPYQAYVEYYSRLGASQPTAAGVSAVSDNQFSVDSLNLANQSAAAAAVDDPDGADGSDESAESRQAHTSIDDLPVIVISDVSDAAPSSSKSTDDPASQSYANIPVIVIEDVDSLSDSQIGDAGAIGYDATSSMNIIDLDDVSAFHSQTGVAELPSYEEHVTDAKESSVPPSAEKKSLDSCSGDTTESEETSDVSQRETSDDVATPQSEHITALGDSIDVSRYLINPSKTSDVSHADTVAENNSKVDTAESSSIRSYGAGECNVQEDVVAAVQKPTQPDTESDAEAMDLSVVLAQAHHVINDILQTSMQRDVTSLPADTEHSFADDLHGVTVDTSTLDVIDVHDVLMA